MLHIGDRNVDPRHLRHRPGVATSSVDHHPRAHGALFGVHLPLAIGQLIQPGHPVFADDPRALLAGPGG
jgi:hypothetical protein